MFLCADRADRTRYEAQLRYLWGLRDANSQGPKLTPVPGYYRGMSRVQLG